MDTLTQRRAVGWSAPTLDRPLRTPPASGPAAVAPGALSQTAWGLAAGFGLDALVGDPRRGHPVALFGALAAVAERVLHRESRTAGAAYAGLLCGAVGLAGAAASEAVGRRPLARSALTAGATWVALGGTSLRREAAAMDAHLRAGDLDGGRERLRSLCGRDAAQLDLDGLARATVESVAENTSDAAVAPLLWGAVAGVPGLLTYRAVNTLDAMVGHRSPRYAEFGWASARADDVANLLPARLTALLAVALAPVVGGRPSSALRAWRRDGGKHPSPNAGPVESAFAGALGRTLGGRLAYSGRVEDRPLLGNGPGPTAPDVARAARLSLVVQLSAAGLLVGLRAGVDALARRTARAGA